MIRHGALCFIAAFVVQVACVCPDSTAGSPHRSPVDLVVSADDSWLVTVNQTSDSISLVNVEAGTVIDEEPVGRRPTAIAITPDGKQVLVSESSSGAVSIFDVRDGELSRVGAIEVGFEPYGIKVSPDGNLAYVALSASAEVAVLDLNSQKLIDKIPVGEWPRYLALSADGTRLAVGCSGYRGIWIIDTQTRELVRKDRCDALNIGHLQMSNDGKHAYFPWVIYRRTPITAGNIRQGWVLATRIARVGTEERIRDVMSLDPRGRAVADPHGLAITSDEQQLVVSASGTHELLIYRLPDLPFSDFGSGNNIPGSLLNNKERFDRIELGGRPLGLRMGKDDRFVYVSNYLLSSVQIVDLKEHRLVREIPLGGPTEPSLARQGEAIFFDAKYSLDQWYSCQSCHYEGGTNAITIDTLVDGSPRTYKTVLPLYNVGETSPWTWHGWQTDLQAAMKKSLTSTMLGPQPSDEDVEKLTAYLKTIGTPHNPFRNSDESISEAATRGQRVFRSEQANCSSCHSGKHFTDGELHDVGTAGKSDKYEGYNTPTLIGVHRRVRFLHDGRAKSLDELLTGAHSPEKVSGSKKLSDKDLQDLIEYLKTL